MTEIKDRIAAIDAFGRDLANKINERVVEEELVGQSPATIRRVEELIERETVEVGMSPDAPPNILPEAFEFHIVRGGITAKPLVTLLRYTGRVGP